MSPATSNVLDDARDRSRRRTSYHPSSLPASNTSYESHSLSRQASASQPQESWIEISSSPSSISVRHTDGDGSNAFIAGHPQVELSTLARRRKRRQHSLDLTQYPVEQPSNTCDSSQEEYDESESESDAVMTSSNEGLNNPPLSQPRTSDFHDATSVPVDDQQCFTPQPNSFSHPPSTHVTPHTSVPGSYFPQPRSAVRPGPPRYSYSEQPARPINNSTSPAHQADHDAALRASLSTLLSCAAAARGLKSGSQTRPAATSAHVDPGTLRMIPESALRHGTTATLRSESPGSSGPLSVSSDASHSSGEKGKRKAGRSTSKERLRAVKKPKAAGAAITVDTAVSPTMLTWAVSVAALVVVSALSFSAGYATGRHSARWQAATGSGAEGNACGMEMAKSGLGLRRLRWSDAVGVVSV